MPGKRILFYILGPLIAGTLILVYMELNSMRHVNDLISANNLLLDEYKITQNLLAAGRGKVVIERNIRGFIESGDTVYLSGLEGYFSEVRHAQQVLRRMADDSISRAMIEEFNRMVDKKLNLFGCVLEAARLHGIQAAEDTINANLPEWVSFAIENNLRKITDERNQRPLPEALRIVDRKPSSSTISFCTDSGGGRPDICVHHLDCQKINKIGEDASGNGQGKGKFFGQYEP